MVAKRIKRWFKKGAGEESAGSSGVEREIRPGVLPSAALPDKRRAAIEQAILQALPDGWEAQWGWIERDVEGRKPGNKPPIDDMQWVIQSVQYDLGNFQIRLTADLGTLIFVHSNDIHIFPVTIEQATLVRLDAFTIPDLSRLLSELVRSCRPNLVHPT